MGFENGMLRGIFGPRRHETTGEWRKLHNEELKANVSIHAGVLQDKNTRKIY